MLQHPVIKTLWIKFYILFLHHLHTYFCRHNQYLLFVSLVPNRTQQYFVSIVFISSCSRTCTVLQYPVSGCVCVLVLQRGVAATNTHTDMQQLANKDEFCCAWQRFSVHYFPLYPACIPDLSSCLSCKDTLSGPDSSSHAHTVCMAHTHSGCAHAPSHWQFYICSEHM